jgi:regulator of replication initiation timing
MKIIRLKDELAQLKSEVARLNTQNARLKTENNNLKNQLDELSRKKDNELTALIEENQTLRQRISELEDQLQTERRMTLPRGLSSSLH